MKPDVLKLVVTSNVQITMTSFIENKLWLGKGFGRTFANPLLFGTSFTGITLWIIWIEWNDKVFKNEQWHESRAKHHIWDELIMYAKAAWKWVIKQIKISSFSAMALLQGFNKMWGARNIFCGRNDLHIEWDWKAQRR